MVAKKQLSYKCAINTDIYKTAHIKTDCFFFHLSRAKISQRSLNLIICMELLAYSATSILKIENTPI